MRRNIVRVAILLLASVQSLSLHAFVHTNFFSSYDYALRMPWAKDTKFRLGLASVEYGSSSTGKDRRGKKQNILQLCDCTQNALAMIKNPLPNISENINEDVPPSALTALLQLAEDDGTRGHLKFKGHFSELDVNFFAGYDLDWHAIPGTLTLSLYVPVIWKEVNHVCITDLTKTDPVNPDDALVRQYLTNDLVDNVSKWGCLDLCAWRHIGIGDITLMLDWWDKYYQDKEYLKAVTLFLKLGLLFPSGKHKNEDKAFSMPFGTDGAWGIPLGVGMELQFVSKIKAGLDVDFLVLFDESRGRRMKTHTDQTEFLLLNKGKAIKEFGLVWKFHLYAQAYHLWRGISAKFAYQFVKYDGDRLTPKCNDFDFCLVNSACQLRESSVHNLIFQLSYDCFSHGKDWSVKPQVSAFYKLPVAGKNIIDNQTVGGQFALNF